MLIKHPILLTVPMTTNVLLQLKIQNNFVNMNTALIDTILSLILAAFKLHYEQERMMDPNPFFQQCFDWFVIKFGCT
jgi:hypothetical protein